MKSLKSEKLWSWWLSDLGKPIQFAIAWIAKNLRDHANLSGTEWLASPPKLTRWAEAAEAIWASGHVDIVLAGEHRLPSQANKQTFWIQTKLSYSALETRSIKEII